MGKTVSTFLEDQDVLAAGVSFNYQNKERVGTKLGGCASIFGNIFIGLFILTQFIGLIFYP
jgi:hypothetical protein